VKIVRKKTAASVHFDLLHETWQRTNLQFARPGSLVNLERPLPVAGRLDGHFVTGHIDGLGRITRAESKGSDHLLEISADTSLMPLIVSKGSIALDGISLTIAELGRNHFCVWIIPHTWEVTALRERKTGDAVNLEMDILGKYVARFMKTGFGKSPRKSN
jgi:riboflavin synthase